MTTTAESLCSVESAASDCSAFTAASFTSGFSSFSFGEAQSAESATVTEESLLVLPAQTAAPTVPALPCLKYDHDEQFEATLRGKSSSIGSSGFGGHNSVYKATVASQSPLYTHRSPCDPLTRIATQQRQHAPQHSGTSSCGVLTSTGVLSLSALVSQDSTAIWSKLAGMTLDSPSSSSSSSSGDVSVSRRRGKQGLVTHSDCGSDEEDADSARWFDSEETAATSRDDPSAKASHGKRAGRAADGFDCSDASLQSLSRAAGFLRGVDRDICDLQRELSPQRECCGHQQQEQQQQQLCDHRSAHSRSCCSLPAGGSRPHSGSTGTRLRASLGDLHSRNRCRAVVTAWGSSCDSHPFSVEGIRRNYAGPCLLCSLDGVAGRKWRAALHPESQ